MAEQHPDSRRVLFIVPPYVVKSATTSKAKVVRSFLAFPYGVLTIATYVRRHCARPIEVSVLDLNLHQGEDPVAVTAAHLRDFAPDVVGISLSYDISYPHLRPLSAAVKAHDPATLVVIGGPASTVSWDDILPDQEHVDALCYGEGEVAMLDLLGAEDMMAALAQDPWVTRDRKTAPGWKFAENLDDVVHVDYSLIDMTGYNMQEAFSPFSRIKDGAERRQFFIVTSRGCPFKCVFCAEPSFHGKGMRYVSIDQVIAHVRHLVNTYGMNVLTIYDDQLLLDRARARELFTRLAEFGLRIEMPNGVTVAYIDAELAGLMSKAGVKTISLAIESGSERVLRDIINKPLRADKVKPVVQALHDNGIFVQAFFINGFPGETSEDRAITARMIDDWGIDWALFNYATPLRGSRLYTICKENGWIDPKHLKIGEVDMIKYLIKAPGIDPETIERETYLMNLYANFVNNYSLRSNDPETAARCFENVLERHPQQAFAHYFLAKASEKVPARRAAADVHRQRYLDIVASDEQWKSYAEYFGLS